MSGPILKNVLCIRADNMGDVIMTSPAMRALKESFESRITLLTSKAGALVSPYLGCVDDTMIFDLPWVKSDGLKSEALLALTEEIRKKEFDAAFIFTVYSQSALPAAMLAYMAGIPVRAAYARENPYQLLTHWIPDPEPYQCIQHQVMRDMALVEQLGATTANDRLLLEIGDGSTFSCLEKLMDRKVRMDQPFIIFHPGVSELKREYPVNYWIEAGRMVRDKYRLPILVTGSESERDLADKIASGIGMHAVSVAGMFSLGEFAVLIDKASCIVSVNTGTIHIAAAMQTPVAVLYAQTNPQHTPWKSAHRILPFSVPNNLKSRNTIIRYVSEKLYNTHLPYPDPQEIISAIDSLISEAIPAPYSH